MAPGSMDFESDLALARALQAQFDEENAHEEVSNFIPEEFRFASPAKKRKIDPPADTSIVAPEWEDLDPTPGIDFNVEKGLDNCFLVDTGTL
jgi:hypothetical protein